MPEAHAARPWHGRCHAAVTRGQQCRCTALYPTIRFCPRLEPRSREALFVPVLCAAARLADIGRFFRGNERKLARSHCLIATPFGPSLLVFVLSSYLSQC